MYEKYALYDNPFKCEHDHEIVGASQNKTFDSLLKFFSFKMAFGKRSGDKFISVLKGEYGTGKSFFLIKLTESTLNKDKRFTQFLEENVKIAVSKFSILTVDKKLPTDIMLHLYRRIIQNLGTNGEHFLVNLNKDLKDKASSKGMDMKNVISELSPDFGKAVLSLSEDCQEQFIAWKWMSAQKLTQKELGALGVRYYINNGELAEKNLFQLLKLLRILDYGLLVVLIDEMEEILTTINERQFWRAFLVIKEIFDKYSDVQYSRLKPMTPIGFVGGMTEDAWLSIDKGAEEEKGITAVRSRISENIFEFGRFNEEDTAEFIKLLLSKARVKRYKGDPLFPFEKDTIRSIQEASYGNPREIINICDKLLQEATARKLHKIDLRTVNDYLSSAGGGESFEEVTHEDNIDDFLEDEEKI
jgi:hypothetical protein